MNVAPLIVVVLGLIVILRVASLVRPGVISGLREHRRGADRAARHTEIELLSALARATHAFGDERTWRDLDLDDVFHSVDYAASEVGRQCLYARLRQPRMDAGQLAAFGGRVASIAADERLTGAIRDTVGVLSDMRSAFLVDLLFGELPPRPRFWWTFPVLSATAIASLAAMAFWPRAFLVLVAIACVNVIAQLAFKQRVKRLVPAIHELPRFLAAAERLAERLTQSGQGDLDAHLSTLRSARNFRTLRRASWWLMFEPGQTNDLLSSLYEYVNLVLLLDVNAFVFTTARIRSAQADLQRIFLALGELDVMQSVGAWRKTLPVWSTPTFSAKEQCLDVEDIVHPLLAAPVANSLSVRSVGVLVTGSNMAGKTTFIRTLGVNAVLAQTLCTVCARGWRAPPLIVRTSIGRSDSLAEGKSYYLAEAESVRALLSAKDAVQQHLFLLDEIFRGTNTSERIAAAYGVLRFLEKGNDLVFVATHDVELLEMLEDRFVGYHFAEQVSESALTFDYRLRPGPSSTRNAIALLRLLGYPAEVLSDALSVVDAEVRYPSRSGHG